MLKFLRRFSHGRTRTKTDEGFKAFHGLNQKISGFVQLLSVCVRGRGKTFGVLLLSMIILAALPTAGRTELLGDTLKPFVSVTQLYDSNVFRVKDREQLKLQVNDDRLADFITVLTAGTGVHYRVSGQVLDLLLERDFLLYSHYTNQNVNRDMISGNLTLSVFDKLKITLDGNYVQAPQPRSDYRGAEINERQDLAAGVTIGYEMVTGVGFAATYRHTNVNYSLPQYRANEYANDLYAGTLSYRLSPDTRLYGSLQREYRDYQSDMRLGQPLVDNSSVSDSIRIGLNRTVGARTTVSGYLGYLERRHDQAADRDFDGVIGHAEITYGLTPSLALILNGERQLYEETYVDRIYSVNEAVAFGLTYQISNKVKASFFEKLTWKSFKDVPDAGVTSRTDWLQDLNAGIEWSPLARLMVSVGYQFSTKDSDEATAVFSAHTIQSGISYRY